MRDDFPRAHRSDRSSAIAVGVFVVAGLAALLVLASQVANQAGLTAEHGGYDLTAEFQDVGALQVRAPVTLAGVVVGRVARIALDPASLEARVTLHIEPRYNDLPKDTSAAIYAQGLRGAEYVALQPGGDTQVLRNRDRILLTQSALDLDGVIGQLLFHAAHRAD